jgi:hypothetical protein
MELRDAELRPPTMPFDKYQGGCGELKRCRSICLKVQMSEAPTVVDYAAATLTLMLSQLETGVSKLSGTHQTPH